MVRGLDKFKEYFEKNSDNYIIIGGTACEHSSFENGIHRANTEALIYLKAKAYLEISERIKRGSKEDSRQISKHKGYNFRLAVM